MANDLNNSRLAGTVNRLPEIKMLKSGLTYIYISLLTTQRWQEERTGSLKTYEDLHSILAFKELARRANSQLTVGSRIYVEGTLRTNCWVEKSAQKCGFSMHLVATAMQILAREADYGRPTKQKPIDASVVLLFPQNDPDTWL